MFNIIRCITCAILILLTGLPVHSADYYVSPDGSDSNPGSIQAPLATLGKALDLVKEEFRKSPDEDCTIWLDQGIFRITERISLHSEEFHNEKASLTIAAMPGTNPVISGGMEIREWISESRGLWKTTVPARTVNNLNSRELFINDQRAIRARYPNKGYLRVAQVGGDRRTNFFFEDDDAFPAPSKPQSTELVLLHDWSISRIPIKEIDYSKNNLKTVDSIGARQPDFFNLDHWEAHPRYYLENDKQFIDADYEWYFDDNEKTIWLKLPTGQDPNKQDIIIPVSEGLLELSGSQERYLKNVRFENLIFEHSAWTIPSRGYAGVQACHYDPRLPSGSSVMGETNNKGWSVVPAAIQGEWVSNSKFTDCTFRHLGGSGLWLGTGSVNNTIADCEFSDISGNGIMMGEGRDRKVDGQVWWKEAPEQVASGNMIERNIVRDCGVQFFGAVGIWCGLTAETTIRQNEIYSLPYTGISIGWMWSPVSTPCRDNILEGNHIHNVMQELSDGGGIYMLGLQPGSQLVRNRIHNVSLNAGRAESNGMFLDEGTTDVIVADNLIYYIAKSPLRFHKATTNVVRDNRLFCKKGVPPIMYNATKEEDIVKINNQVLTEDEKGYENLLKEAVEDWKTRKR